MMSMGHNAIAVHAGQRFGRLSVVEETEPLSRHVRVFRCRCDCGTLISARLANLRSGHTQSCGCLMRERTVAANRTHGLTVGRQIAREFVVWAGIIDRCENPRSHVFQHYGGRGIRMCERWRLSAATFLSDMGRCPSSHHSLDRIDNEGDYSPGNCRWTDKLTQANNTRANRLLTHDGRTRTLAQWARDCRLPYKVLHARLNRYGWSVARALNEPLNHR